MANSGGIGVLSENEVTLENFEVESGDQMMSSQAFHGSRVGTPMHKTNSLRGEKKKSSGAKGDEMVAHAIGEVVEALEEGNFILANSLQHVIKEENIWINLDIEIEPHLRTRAYNFLVRNPSMMTSYFGCPITDCKEVSFDLMFGPHDN